MKKMNSYTLVICIFLLFLFNCNFKKSDDSTIEFNKVESNDKERWKKNDKITLDCINLSGQNNDEKFCVNYLNDSLANVLFFHDNGIIDTFELPNNYLYPSIISINNPSAFILHYLNKNETRDTNSFLLMTIPKGKNKKLALIAEISSLNQSSARGYYPPDIFINQKNSVIFNQVIEKNNALEEAELNLKNNKNLLTNQKEYSQKEMNDSKPLIFDDDNSSAGLDFFGELFNTFMFPSEDGQIKTKEEKDRTVNIDVRKIGTTDFTTPNLDLERGNKVMAEHKKRMTRLAYIATKNKFGSFLKEEDVKWIPYE